MINCCHYYTTLACRRYHDQTTRCVIPDHARFESPSHQILSWARGCHVIIKLVRPEGTCGLSTWAGFTACTFALRGTSVGRSQRAPLPPWLRLLAMLYFTVPAFVRQVSSVWKLLESWIGEWNDICSPCFIEGSTVLRDSLPASPAIFATTPPTSIHLLPTSTCLLLPPDSSCAHSSGQQPPPSARHERSEPTKPTKTTLTGLWAIPIEVEKIGAMSVCQVLHLSRFGRA